jgi:hypothetical protein
LVVGHHRFNAGRAKALMLAQFNDAAAEPVPLAYLLTLLTNKAARRWILQRQYPLAGQKDHVFGHTIDATKVATITDIRR